MTLAARRLAICARCPLMRRSPLGPRCAACGCFLALKARMAGQACPHGLWAAAGT